MELFDKGPCTLIVPLHKDKPLRKLHRIKGRLIIIFVRWSVSLEAALRDDWLPEDTSCTVHIQTQILTVVHKHGIMIKPAVNIRWITVPYQIDKWFQLSSHKHLHSALFWKMLKMALLSWKPRIWSAYVPQYVLFFWCYKFLRLNKTFNYRAYFMHCN